jgi:hypothetical protein
MTNPYHLVHDYVSHDTADALVQMALDAQAGDIVGAAVITFMKGRRYAVNAYGAAEKNATLTRGCLMVLDDHLRDLIHHRDPFETR